MNMKRKKIIVAVAVSACYILGMALQTIQSQYDG